MGSTKTKADLFVEYPGEPAFYIDKIREFSYSSDVLAVGEVCTVSVVLDEEGQTARKLRSGAEARLRLSHPAVNGGKPTTKHLGRIITKDMDEDQGTVTIQIADLGWHLQKCHAPLWKRVRGLDMSRLIDPKVAKAFIDSTFGFRGAETGGVNLRGLNIKLGRGAVVEATQKAIGPLQVVQVEPGESFLDTIQRYAKKYNLLINVTADGWIQAWNPNYERPPAYHFNSVKGRSNVHNVKRHDDISTRYTSVSCVGEVVNLGVATNDPQDPNCTKRRGTYVAATDPKTGLPAPLPFTHRHTFGEGEMFTREQARRLAEWAWKRGMFDSHYVTVTVPDHFQIDRFSGEGTWYEADQMCSVDFPKSDLYGAYYVQSVQCKSTPGEHDQTTLVLRWPHLLSASYGVWRNAPVYRSPEAQAANKPGTGKGQ